MVLLTLLSMLAAAVHVIILLLATYTAALIKVICHNLCVQWHYQLYMDRTGEIVPGGIILSVKLWFLTNGEETLKIGPDQPQ